MTEPRRDLPYFDFLLHEFGRGDADLTKAFGLHIHWGYWSDAAEADGSIENFAAAAERLCSKVCDAAGVARDMRMLDVGCGLGGTLASLNERFDGLLLAGLNIDLRQLRRARNQVAPRDGNRLSLVNGDACRLPFADGSFDVVVAVESIFQFPNRKRFLREAYRVLRPGGRLALSDFVPRGRTLPFLMAFYLFSRRAIEDCYGHCDCTCTLSRYRSLAERAGFTSVVHDDITAHTLPTYEILRRFERGTKSGFEADARKATRFLDFVSRAGWLRYEILTFVREQPARGDSR